MFYFVSFVGMSLDLFFFACVVGYINYCAQKIKHLDAFIPESLI